MTILETILFCIVSVETTIIIYFLSIKISRERRASNAIKAMSYQKHKRGLPHEARTILSDMEDRESQKNSLQRGGNLFQNKTSKETESQE